MTPIVLSRLAHTWLIDVDGTLVRHNGHKNGGDELLPGVKEFWNTIPQEDVIILLSARSESERSLTAEFLHSQSIRFDHMLFDMPTGERVVINDSKPKGLKTALSVNIPRDRGLGGIRIIFDNDA